MRKGKCAVCGQETFDPLLSDLKKKDSRNFNSVDTSIFLLYQIILEI